MSEVNESRGMIERLSGSVVDTIRTFRSDNWQVVEEAIDQISGAISGRAQFAPEAAWTPEQWAAATRHDPQASELAGKIVRHALRFGWDLRTAGQPVEAMKLRDAYRFEEERLEVPDHLRRGATWGRSQGFAITWLGAEGDQEKAFVPGPRLSWLHTVPATHISVHSEDVNADTRSPRYLRPEFYRIRIAKGAPTQTARFPGGARVHWSRVVTWPGNDLVDPDLVADFWRDDSVLEAARAALDVSGRNHQASANLLRRVSQVVVKFRNLAELISLNKARELRERVRLLERGRNVDRILSLDKEESIETVTQPLAGVGEIHAITDRRVASSAAMPRSVLMNDGMTPEEVKAWEAEVVGWQSMVLRPRHERIAAAILGQKGFVKGEPESWAIDYRAVSVVPPDTRATIRKTNAEADQIEINTGVVTPEAVTLARHTGIGMGEINLEPAEVEAALRRRSELAAEPPKDNARMGTVAPRAGGGQLAIVQAVRAGTISRESGIEILAQTFQLLREQAEKMIGPAPEKKDEPMAGDVAGVGAVAAVQDTALNGAQVAELRGTLEAVKAGTLDRDAALELIVVSFPSVSRETAGRMVDAQARSREPESDEPDEADDATDGAVVVAAPGAKRGPDPEPSNGVGAGAPQGAPNANAGGAPSNPATIEPKGE